jgi:anti-sigma regulatory factor (Ser/Thr protein kinase)
MHSGRFVIRTLSEGHDLAALLANACPEPQRTVLGLNELIVNAIEHGSLEISYAEKGELVSQGRWHEEVERRLGLDAYRERTVEILFSRDSGTDSGRIDITIRDQGPGFDWREYLQLSPERGMDNHGRGVAMANMLSFDRIEYQGRGNIVVGSILRGVDRSE